VIIKLIEKIFFDPSFFAARIYFSNLICIINQGVDCEDCDSRYDSCTCEKCYDPNGCRQIYCICEYDASTATILLKTLEILDEYITNETDKNKLIKILFDKFLYFKFYELLLEINVHNQNNDIESLRNKESIKEVIALYRNRAVQDYIKSNHIGIDYDRIDNFIKSKNPRKVLVNAKKKSNKTKFGKRNIK